MTQVPGNQPTQGQGVGFVQAWFTVPTPTILDAKHSGQEAQQEVLLTFVGMTFGLVGDTTLTIFPPIVTVVKLAPSAPFTTSTMGPSLPSSRCRGPRGPRRVSGDGRGVSPLAGRVVQDLIQGPRRLRQASTGSSV